MFSFLLSSSYNLIAQANEVIVLLEPESSQKILSWQNTSSLSVDTWQVDILKEELVGGVTTLVPQIQFFQDKEYVGINNQYMSSGYYYEIYGLDVSGNIIVDNGGPVLLCPSCNVSLICEQKCNGDYYAYAIEQFGSSTVGYFLSPKQTVAWFNEDTHTSVPYYHYVSLSTWDNWNATNTNNYDYSFKTIRFNTNDLPSGFFVKDGQGNGLTGDIIGIEKKMGDYEVYAVKRTSSLILQSCNSLSGFIATFNQYKANCNQSGITYPVLECIPDPNFFILTDTITVFEDDPSVHDTCATCLHQFQTSFTWYMCITASDTFWSTVPCSQGGQGILPLPRLNTLLEYVTNSNTQDHLAGSDFMQFEFQKVGDTSYSLILKPSDIEQVNGSLSFDEYTFTDGLYKLNIFYSNNVLVPVFFESTGSVVAPTTLLSNYLYATIYPVPIVNNEFSINFSSQRDLVFTYEMFDLNGNLLSSKVFDIKDGEEIVYHTYVDPNISLPSNMLVNKFSFEDGSSFTIQTITSVN